MHTGILPPDPGVMIMIGIFDEGNVRFDAFFVYLQM
jgi:hypothetical protein